MTNEEKGQYIEYLSLSDELESAAESGADIYLNGCRYDVRDIAAICVFNEEGGYSKSLTSRSGRQPDIINFQVAQ